MYRCVWMARDNVTACCYSMCMWEVMFQPRECGSCVEESFVDYCIVIIICNYGVLCYYTYK